MLKTLKRLFLGAAILTPTAIVLLVGLKLSPDALAVIIGMMLGILASVPVSVVLVILLTRREGYAGKNGGSAGQMSYQPPVIVVNGQQAPPNGYPFGPPSTITKGASNSETPQGGYAMGLPAQRTFTVIGEEDNFQI